MDSSTFIGLTAGLGCGIVVGFIMRGRFKLFNPKSPNVSENGAAVGMMGESSGENKLVMVVRTDLKMGKGKIAAQCSHAAVLAYRTCGKKNPHILKQWETHGQPKVVVKTDNEEEMMALAQHARSLGLTASIIHDAGRTQIAPNSKTVLGVGPGPADLVDKVTGHLKLM